MPGCSTACCCRGWLTSACTEMAHCNRQTSCQLPSLPELVHFRSIAWGCDSQGEQHHCPTHNCTTQHQNSVLGREPCHQEHDCRLPANPSTQPHLNWFVARTCWGRPCARPMGARMPICCAMAAAMWSAGCMAAPSLLRKAFDSTRPRLPERRPSTTTPTGSRDGGRAVELGWYNALLSMLLIMAASGPVSPDRPESLGGAAGWQGSAVSEVKRCMASR